MVGIHLLVYSLVCLPGYTTPATLLMTDAADPGAPTAAGREEALGSRLRIVRERGPLCAKRPPFSLER